MKIAVMTSGGDAPGMNAAIRAVVRHALYKEHEVVGVLRGYLGLLNREFKEMSSRDVGGILNRGGTILLTARAPQFCEEEQQDKAIQILRDERIDGLIVIGGNGSQTGAYRLHKKGFPVVGIASTIDNDLVGTDQTIGFDTALNNAISAIDKIRDTATSHERVFVIEVMGRNVGMLALHCGIAVGADEIIVPEIAYDIENIVNRIQSSFDLGKKHFIIILAEGAGKARDFSEKLNQFGNIDAKMSVLGYIQRGGDPTYIDRFLATNFGAFAIYAISHGMSGKIVGIKNNELTLIDMKDVVGKHKSIDISLYQLTEALSI